MCEPITTTQAVTMAFSGVTSLIGYVQQAQEADYQNRVIAQRNQETADRNAQQAELHRQAQENADAAYAAEVAALNARLQEEAAADGRDLTSAEIEAAQARASARVSAGESGVAGVSVDALEADYMRGLAAYRDQVSESYAYLTQQVGREKDAAEVSRVNRINSAMPQYDGYEAGVSGPSFLPVVAGIGAQALDAVSTNRDARLRAEGAGPATRRLTSSPKRSASATIKRIKPNA